MTSRNHAERVEYVITSLESLGVRLPEQSRIKQFRRAFVDHEGHWRTAQLTDGSFKIALESLRDLTLLEAICESAASLSHLDGFDQRVKRLQEDSALPENDKTDSSGRDAQLELFVAATCVRGPFTNVGFGSPDISCEIGSEPWSIEVKRVKSESKLETRIRQAAHQVREARKPGVVLVDVTQAFNTFNEAITRPLTAQQFQLAHGRALQKCIDFYHPRLQEWVRGKGVRGVYFFNSILRRNTEGGWQLETIHMDVNTARENLRRQREWAQFTRAFGLAIDSLSK